MNVRTHLKAGSSPNETFKVSCDDAWDEGYDWGYMTGYAEGRQG
jgi:hypothetical protein